MAVWMGITIMDSIGICSWNSNQNWNITRAFRKCYSMHQKSRMMDTRDIKGKFTKGSFCARIEIDGTTKMKKIKSQKHALFWRCPFHVFDFDVRFEKEIWMVFEFITNAWISSFFVNCEVEMSHAPRHSTWHNDLFIRIQHRVRRESNHHGAQSQCYCDNELSTQSQMRIYINNDWNQE